MQRMNNQRRALFLVLLTAMASVALVAGVTLATNPDDREPGRLPLAIPTTIPASEQTPQQLVVPVQQLEALRSDAAINLEWSGPAQIRLNRPNEYTLKVSNVSTQPVQKVTIQVRAPRDAKISKTTPEAQVIDGIQLWELGTLDFQESKRLKITLVPSTKGETTCQAWVTFTGTTGMKVNVLEPKLNVSLETPKEVHQSSPIPVIVKVQNTGECDLASVRIRLFRQGESQPIEELTQPLTVNETRSFKLQGHAAANEKEHIFRVEAIAEEDQIVAEATSSTAVLMPALQTTLTGPKELYVGQVGTYTATVTNTGAIPLDVNYRCLAPTGWRYMTPQMNGTISQQNLQPGQSMTQRFQAMPTVGGNGVFTFFANAGDRVSAQGDYTTAAVGIPALRMELLDTADPVAHGQDTSYEIRVVNTGTKSDTNIVIHCPIPKSLRFVKASGPVDYTTTELNGVTMLRFEPVRELSPGTEAVFRVHVKAIATGDIRFKAVMNSPSLATSVVKEESTRIFNAK